MSELITDESVPTPEQCCSPSRLYVNWWQGLAQTKPDSCSAMRKEA